MSLRGLSRFESLLVQEHRCTQSIIARFTIDPNSGVAYLYAGQVQAALGRKIEASAYIDRAKKLMPADPRPAEVAKMLRL